MFIDVQKLLRVRDPKLLLKLMKKSWGSIVYLKMIGEVFKRYYKISKKSIVDA